MEKDTFEYLITRLQADIADVDAWPRPTTSVRRCLLALISAKAPVTTDEIVAPFPTMTASQATVALQQLAGLLALYGSPLRVHRRQAPDKKIRIYEYYLSQS